MLKHLLLLCACLGSQVMAHPGHGESSPHSHASDLIGMLVLAFVLLGIWWETRK